MNMEELFLVKHKIVKLTLLIYVTELIKHLFIHHTKILTEYDYLKTIRVFNKYYIS